MLLALTLVTLWQLPALAQETSGVMMVVKGDIKVTSGGKTESAKVGRKVFSGDAIIAGADSRAKIVMSDRNILNVSPDSKVVIEKYTNDPKSDSRAVELKVEYGKVRAQVEQKYDGEKNKFNIKTPTAVAGVRGTDFITGYSLRTRQTSIVTFSGMVAVGQPGAAGEIKNPVFVRPGQTTNVGDGKPPEPPKPMPKEDLQNMNQETAGGPTPPAPANSEQQPANEQAKEQPKEQPKDQPKDQQAAQPKEQPKEQPKDQQAAQPKESANQPKEQAGTQPKEQAPQPQSQVSGGNNNEGGASANRGPASAGPEASGPNKKDPSPPAKAPSNTAGSSDASRSPASANSGGGTPTGTAAPAPAGAKAPAPVAGGMSPPSMPTMGPVTLDASALPQAQGPNIPRLPAAINPIVTLPTQNQFVNDTIKNTGPSKVTIQINK